MEVVCCGSILWAWAQKVFRRTKTAGSRSGPQVAKVTKLDKLNGVGFYSVYSLKFRRAPFTTLTLQSPLLRWLWKDLDAGELGGIVTWQTLGLEQLQGRTGSCRALFPMARISGIRKKPRDGRCVSGHLERCFLWRLPVDASQLAHYLVFLPASQSHEVEIMAWTQLSQRLGAHSSFTQFCFHPQLLCAEARQHWQQAGNRSIHDNTRARIASC